MCRHISKLSCSSRNRLKEYELCPIWYLWPTCPAKRVCQFTTHVYHSKSLSPFPFVFCIFLFMNKLRHLNLTGSVPISWFAKHFATNDTIQPSEEPTGRQGRDTLLLSLLGKLRHRQVLGCGSPSWPSFQIPSRHPGKQHTQRKDLKDRIWDDDPEKGLSKRPVWTPTPPVWVSLPDCRRDLAPTGCSSCPTSSVWPTAATVMAGSVPTGHKGRTLHHGSS